MIEVSQPPPAGRLAKHRPSRRAGRHSAAAYHRSRSTWPTARPIINGLAADDAAARNHRWAHAAASKEISRQADDAAVSVVSLTRLLQLFHARWQVVCAHISSAVHSTYQCPAAPLSARYYAKIAPVTPSQHSLLRLISVSRLIQ